MTFMECEDCKLSTHELKEYYMVHYHVWDLVCPRNIMLCIGCLEERLGRELNASDFIDCPVNWIMSLLNDGFWSRGSERSERFNDRVTRVFDLKGKEMNILDNGIT